MPTLGRNQARQPHWAAYNLLFHSALPPFEGEEAQARELPAKVLLRPWSNLIILCPLELVQPSLPST